MDITLKAFRRVFTFNVSKNFIFSVSKIKMPNCIIFSPVLTMAVALEAFSLQICMWFLHFNKNSARTVKNWKLYCKQLPLYIPLLLNLPLQYWMFVCVVSIIYKIVFILISTETPTEENHDIFSICFFSQILTFHTTARENLEPSYLALSNTSTNIQTFICSFASCLLHTNIYLCWENRNTRWPFDIIYT